MNSERNKNFLACLEKHLKSPAHQKLVQGGWTLVGTGILTEPWTIKRPGVVDDCLREATKRAKSATVSPENMQEETMDFSIDPELPIPSSSSVDSATNTVSSQTDSIEATNHSFTESTAQTDLVEVSYRTCSCTESGAQTEPDVTDVLSDILGIPVTAENIISVLRGYPYVVAMVRNLVRREPSPGIGIQLHNTKAHEPVLVATSGKLGLKYSLGVVTELNELTGGPAPSTVKKVVRTGIPVLYFYNKSNITEHLRVAKGNL